MLSRVMVFFICMAGHLISYSQIQITLTIPRANSPYLSDYIGYESSQVLIISNPTATRQQIYLRGKVEQLSTPGYFLRTKRNYKPSLPIVLEPFETKTLFATSGDFGFLNERNLEDNVPANVRRHIQLNGILPEGDYQICVEALDFISDQPLSLPEPSGCQFFTVTLGSPPQLVFPVCSDTIDNLFPNFMWTPAISTVPLGLVQYTLYIVEYNSKALNPREVMEQSINYNAGNPIVIRRLLMNTYPYSPTDIPLKQNTTYIASVVATDNRSGAMFENQGRSEICIFHTGDKRFAEPPTLIGQGPQIVQSSSGLPEYFTQPTLKGKLRYYWNVSGNATAYNNRGELVSFSGISIPKIRRNQDEGQQSGGLGNLANNFAQNGSFSHHLTGIEQNNSSIGLQEEVSTRFGQVSFAGNANSGFGQAGAGLVTEVSPPAGALFNAGLINFDGYGGFVNSALAGVSVHLILGKQMVTNYSCANLSTVEGNLVSEGPILGTAITTADGSFSFNIPTLSQINFSWQQGQWPSGGDVCYGSAVYQYRNVLMVKLSGGNAPYAHPIQAVSGIPENGELGTFFSLVRTFNLEVNLKEKWNEAANTTFSQMQALLLRSIPVNSIYPKDAFSPGNFNEKPEIMISGVNYRVFGKSNETDGTSTCIISNVPWMSCPDTRFSIFVQPFDNFTTTLNYTNTPTPLYMVKKSIYDQCFTNYNFNFQGSCIVGLCTEKINTYSSISPSEYWLFHKQYLTVGPPRIYAKVINEAASGQMSDLSRAEPGATFRIWAVGYHGMQRLKSSLGYTWGWWLALPNSNMGSISNVANSGVVVSHSLSHLTSGMKLAYTGTTGNDGRIDRNVWDWKLSSDQTGLYFDGKKKGDQVGFFYFVEVLKEGFKNNKAAIKILNAANANNVTGDMAYLQRGEAFNAGEIKLEPKGQVELYFRNVKNQNVKIKQTFYIDESTGQAGIVKSSTRRIVPDIGLREVANLYVPSGEVRIVVIPEDEDMYVRDTITLQVPESGILKREVIVPLKMHRIRFFVRSQNGVPILHSRLRLLYANADFDHSINCQIPGMQSHPFVPYPWPDLLQQNDKVTDMNGMACFAFKNAGTNFTFRIIGPPNQNYIVTNKTVYSVAGKKWVNVVVELREGRTVRGHVRFNNTPVVNARVRIKNSNPVVEVFTNNEGYYEMKGVPNDTILTFTASKKGFVGTEYTEGQNQSNWRARIIQQLTGNTTIIDYNLNVYDGLDLSQILGYDAEITSLTEKFDGSTSDYAEEMNSGYQNTGVVEVSGILDLNNMQDGVFSMSETNTADQTIETIEFSKLKLIPDVDLVNEGGIPFGKPEILPLTTDMNFAKIKIFDQYFADFGDAVKGVRVNKIAQFLQNKGFVQGKINIDLLSFTAQLLRLPANQKIHIRHNNASIPVTDIPIYPAAGNLFFNVAQGLPVSNQTGNDLIYHYADITCIAQQTTSRLLPDSLSFDSRIQTDFDHVQQKNINLSVGSVSFIPGGGISAFNRSVNKNTRLAGDFSFDWTQIAFSNSGVRFEGVLKLRGIELPVSNAYLLRDRFSLPSQSLQIQSLSLMGIVPLSIRNGTSVDFGYDFYERQAWYLNIFSNNNIAATLSGNHLTGLDAGTQININSIWLYSNGIETVNLFGTNTSTLKNIVPTTIHNMAMTPNSLKLQVSMELEIPDFETISTDLLFEKNNQNNALNHYILENRTLANRTLNNLTFGFHPSDHKLLGTTQALNITDGKLEISGTISNPRREIFKDIRCTVTKTSQGIRLAVNEQLGQSIRLGADAGSPVVVSALEGNMDVLNNSWSMFHLRGDMPESLGFHPDNRRVRYDVLSQGELTMVNQAVKLQNMEGSLDGLSMNYDLQNHRLMGSMSFSEEVGGMQVYGESEIVLDRHGYYFLAHGGFTMSNPSAEGQAFIIFGSYKHKESDRRISIENALKSASYYYLNMGELPKGFTQMSQINGFYFSAGSTVPVPVIPNFDLNVGIAQAKLEVNVGAEVRVGIAFGNVNSYNLGFGIFIDAEIGVGASIGIACAGVTIYGRAGVDFDGTYWSNGNWSVTAQGFLVLGGCAYMGGGLCDSDCCCITCVKAEFCGEVRFIIGGTLNQSGSDWSIQFAADNTSEQ